MARVKITHLTICPSLKERYGRSLGLWLSAVFPLRAALRGLLSLLVEHNGEFFAVDTDIERKPFQTSAPQLRGWPYAAEPLQIHDTDHALNNAALMEVMHFRFAKIDPPIRWNPFAVKTR
jgi:hypothetical protein